MRDYLYRWLNLLLFFFPVMIVMEVANAPSILMFPAACLAIIPLAGLMGRATEDLAEHAGSTIGGLLNATFGNAAELIIGIAAISKGLGPVVKASLTGSILGNLLFVMGLSALAGGLRFKRQLFNPAMTRSGVTMMSVAVIGMLVPGIYHYLVGRHVPTHRLPNIETMSLIISGVLIVNYGLGLLFSLKTHREHLGDDEIGAANYVTGTTLEQDKPAHTVPVWLSVTVLLVSTLCVVVCSEILVHAVEPVMHQLGLRELFVGAVIIAIIGNAAEHSTAVLMAMRNKMDLAMQICISSSLQIALFVTPALVFISLAMGRPMTLEFMPAEIMAIMASVFIVMNVAGDGESNWFEGSQLISLYVVLAVGFFFI